MTEPTAPRSRKPAEPAPAPTPGADAPAAEKPKRSPRGPREKSDPEIAAIDLIVKTLRPLSQRARARVLAWAAERFGPDDDDLPKLSEMRGMLADPDFPNAGP